MSGPPTDTEKKCRPEKCLGLQNAFLAGSAGAEGLEGWACSNELAEERQSCNLQIVEGCAVLRPVRTEARAEEFGFV